MFPVRPRTGQLPADRNRHLLRRRTSQRYPAITDTINRCALLGSLAQQERAGQYADDYITPDLSQIAFRRFDRIAGRPARSATALQ